jgi:arylsulfatase A-like enzyme
MGIMKRRQFLKTFIGAGFFAGINTVLRGTTEFELNDRRPARPNLILILADDLGYGDLGCYGQKMIKTPHIDQMAVQGIRFTQHYSGSAFCAPSRCVLLTGLHTGHARVRANGQGPLRNDDITLAKMLKSAGYKTACIGKWGIDNSPPGAPITSGFDFFYGLLGGRQAWNYYPEFIYRNAQKVSLGNLVKDGVAIRRADYTHDLCVDKAIEFINRNRDQPFFLYLPLQILHLNNAADRNGRKHLQEDSGDALRGGHEGPDFGVYAKEDWPGPMRGRAAMISRLDDAVGKIIARLKELDIDEKTLVIFTSDNGPEDEDSADPDFFNSAGQLRGAKGSLYEAGIRVPFIARWPGQVDANKVSTHISAFQDIMPTFAQFAHADCPKTDGISLVPVLSGDFIAQKEHEFLYWELAMRGGSQTIRAGRWKALRMNTRKNPNGPLELYDLDTDPAEKHNLAQSYPELIERLAKYMKTAHTEPSTF